jgi:predicted ATPase
MARLDRLGAAKEVAQIAAVIRREVSYELLHAVHPISETNLQQALNRLADAELLYVRGIAPDAIYQFKHALIRDAAYEALLKSRRRELHLIVARTIDDKFSALKETHPEILAQHWTEAGETESAITAWTSASANAAGHHAYREAEQHSRDALAALHKLPESPQRDSREFEMQVALGNAMAATRGFSAIETAEAYSRARILTEHAGGESIDVFFGLHSSAHTRGEARHALAIADQMLEIARRLDTPRTLAIAHYVQGLPRHYLGDLAGARQHCALAFNR